MVETDRKLDSMCLQASNLLQPIKEGQVVQRGDIGTLHQCSRDLSRLRQGFTHIPWGSHWSSMSYSKPLIMTCISHTQKGYPLYSLLLLGPCVIGKVMRTAVSEDVL